MKPILKPVGYSEKSEETYTVSVYTEAKREFHTAIPFL